jgi:hypothetical protein
MTASSFPMPSVMWTSSEMRPLAISGRSKALMFWPVTCHAIDLPSTLS